ncbi:hypothetical protein HDE_05051 [Halotydeus destructor]|nr:hypothetical protein HDE_05051 [Halotydeus destructor]
MITEGGQANRGLKRKFTELEVEQIELGSSNHHSSHHHHHIVDVVNDHSDDDSDSDHLSSPTTDQLLEQLTTNCPTNCTLCQASDDSCTEASSDTITKCPSTDTDDEDGGTITLTQLSSASSQSQSPSKGQMSYTRLRQIMFNVSMGKLNRYRQTPDPRLLRSVLICNTLKRIERDLDKEGIKITFGPAGVSFLPPSSGVTTVNSSPPLPPPTPPPSILFDCVT